MTRPAPARTFPPEVATPGEVSAIIARCSLRAPTGVRNKALLTLLYRSGLRIGEALALRPTDVNLAQHTIRVLHGKSSAATGKGASNDGQAGKASTRGFHPSADDALVRWLDTRKRLGLKPSAPLFCTLAGGPLQPKYVREMLHRKAQAALGEGRRVTPHTLRHTFAAELEQAGMPVTQISKLLGHSSIAVTHRYLDHLTNGQAVEALATVDLPPLAEG
jgi:site-specific recombinase XerD